MNNPAASTMFQRFMRWTVILAVISGISTVLLLALMKLLQGGGNNDAPLVVGFLIFMFVLVLGLIFSMSAAALSGFWFDQRETPFEFAIAPQRLKAATWALFCLVFPVLVMIGAGIVGVSASIFVLGQIALVLGVIASFVANSVINSMAHDVRSDPAGKQKRLNKLTDDADTSDEKDTLSRIAEDTTAQQKLV